MATTVQSSFIHGSNSNNNRPFQSTRRCQHSFTRDTHACRTTSTTSFLTFNRSNRSFSSNFQLQAFSNDDDDDDDYDDNESIESLQSLEQARQRFEEMMSMPKDNQESKTTSSSASTESTSSNNLDEIDALTSLSSPSPEEEEIYQSTKTIQKAVLSNQKSPPPLTAILRERRLKEITLLATLTTSDDAINELWALWIAERGTQPAAQLLHAEELMSVESWSEAEQLLLKLVAEHGIHWAEPVNRLATLYYMQGKAEQSRALCEIVLQTKPWHFGALSGIVLVCTAMNDATGAKKWAGKRLPPLNGGNEDSRRRDWVDTAVHAAKNSLKKASLVGRDQSIGVDEVQFRNFRATLENNLGSAVGDQGIDHEDASSDSWQ